MHSEIFTSVKTGHKSPLFQFVVNVSQSLLYNELLLMLCFNSLFLKKVLGTVFRASCCSLFNL